MLKNLLRRIMRSSEVPCTAPICHKSSDLYTMDEVMMELPVGVGSSIHTQASEYNQPVTIDNSVAITMLGQYHG